MKYGINTLDDFAWAGRTVLCRVDINAPLDKETGGLRDMTRLQGCAPTVRELAEAGARVVLLAHQGGDLEYHNYASTEPHAAVMSELIGRPWASSTTSAGRPRATRSAGLADGEVLLLDNVRFCGEELTLFETRLNLSPEDQAKTLVVRKLAPLADLYVCDAFAAAHRSQPTLVGFEQLLPSAMGRLFEKEYANLARLREDPARPCVFLLGGTKIQEAFPMMAAALRDGVVDTVLTAGLVANVMLAADGVDIGAPSMDFIRASQLERFVEESKAILAEHGDKVVLPVDLAYVQGRGAGRGRRGRPAGRGAARRPRPHGRGRVRGCHRRRRHRVRQRPGRRVREAGDRVRHQGAVGGHGVRGRLQRAGRRRQRDRHEPLRPRRPLRLRVHRRRRHGAVPQRQADAGDRGAQGLGRARCRPGGLLTGVPVIPALVPHRTAFLAVDLQNCFVADSPVAVPEGPAVLERVNRLAAVCREAGVLVVPTQFVLEPGGADLGVLAWTSPPARAGILDRGTLTAALHPGLVVDPDRDVLIEKPRFGAFYRTGLHGLLVERAVDTVIIGGLLTNICCETTAREAAVRDFAVYFLSDGTATSDMNGATARSCRGRRWPRWASCSPGS